MTFLTPEKARAMVGKRVLVSSHKVTNATATVNRYLKRNHHFWVYLDKPILTKDRSRKTRWHKCNAGNVKEVLND